MLELRSYQPCPEPLFTFMHGQRAAWAQHTPRQNRLLAALPREDYERLQPALEPVPLPLGCAVHRSGDREKYLYFLTAGTVSRICVTQSRQQAELSVIGSEGVIGIALLLGGESAPSQAVVLSAGCAYRLGADQLKEEFKRGGPLQHVLLHYIQALIAQIGQIAVCNRHHSLEQQLCRWILSNLDRFGSNALTTTQEMIAEMLGVSRGGVTEAAGKLQKAGLIQCSRGRIAVLDRPRLEARACECYAVVKREYDRLLPQYCQDEGAAWRHSGHARSQ